ncbi:hypothetical protein [Streptomyces sp. NPDC058869]|uniref:hypothetical protein n=1 Tax=Streptomyces sp. NPDC058869 TaxID=3346659 RepID=UPI0036C706F6
MAKRRYSGPTCPVGSAAGTAGEGPFGQARCALNGRFVAMENNYTGPLRYALRARSPEVSGSWEQFELFEIGGRPRSGRNGRPAADSGACPCPCPCPCPGR